MNAKRPQFGDLNVDEEKPCHSPASMLEPVFEDSESEDSDGAGFDDVGFENAGFDVAELIVVEFCPSEEQESGLILSCSG